MTEIRKSKLVFSQQYLSYDSTKSYVMDTQKSCLTEYQQQRV